MGSTMWCRACSASRNHIGLSGNMWEHAESGDLVYRCTTCDHLRTREIVELEGGTRIKFAVGSETRTLARDGHLKREAGET